MNIILLERVEKLGQMGEFVSVKSGYARNFLFPQGKAVFASKENIKMFEEKKSQLEGENISRKKEAQNLADNIKFKEVVLIRASSESGQLYGSVSAKDISNVVTKAGLSINKSQINLNKALKTLSYPLCKKASEQSNTFILCVFLSITTKIISYPNSC